MRITPDRSRCHSCRKPANQHSVRGDGVLVCEDGRLFEVKVARPGHASQSFGEDEITLLKKLFEALNRGGDVQVLLRSGAYPKLCAKVRNMHAKVLRDLAAEVGDT